MRKVKKLPMRMCVACREMRTKRELIRLVRTAEGSVEIDFTGKRSGRGAYLCASSRCLNAAIKGGRLEKSLHRSLTPDVISRIQEEVIRYENDSTASGSGAART
ncbi:MAG: YlxR family protein [Eubacteriales bacterium]|jgi:predicted RNA-binding protein YlxR (DUF448 family)|nr:YlxR family protein [Bacillota bacterium]MBV1727427.1 YlxR family protein [Desulforudis sp.]MDP3051582.1 YlxR family protein [Eubacteriales bacterium]MDQ7789696.1 YlxR family protein [Clostridia bacterium]MBU4532901.1 YlxR family protein [Bacillota bacterium]